MKKITKSVTKITKRQILRTGVALIQKNFYNVQENLNQKNLKKSHVLTLQLAKHSKVALTIFQDSGQWVLQKIELFKRRLGLWISVAAISVYIIIQTLVPTYSGPNVLELRGGVLPGATGFPVKPMSPRGQPRVNKGIFPSPTAPKHIAGTNLGKYNTNGTLRTTDGSTTGKPPGVTGQPGRVATGLSAQKQNHNGSAKYKSALKELQEAASKGNSVKITFDFPTPRLQREVEQTRKNQDSWNDILRLVEKVAKGHVKPGIGNRSVSSKEATDGKTLKFQEGRGKKGGRIYGRQKTTENGTSFHINGVSTKKNQESVISNLKTAVRDGTIQK